MSLSIRSLEEYLLSKDKKQFISHLIPGTQEHSFFSLIYELHTAQKFTKDEEVQQFVRKYGYPEADSIEILSWLKKYDHPDTPPEQKIQILEELREKYFSGNFTYSKPSNISSSTFQTTESKLPTELDENLISLNDQIAQAYNYPNTFGNLSPALYPKFDIEKLLNGSPSIYQEFIERANPTDFDNFPAILAKYVEREKVVNKNKSGDIIPIKVLKKLTLEQLQSLAKLVPEIEKEQAFITELFRKEFKIPSGKTAGYDLEKPEKRELFLRIYNTAKSSSNTLYDSIARNALFHILHLGAQINKFSKDLFLEYLKNPARVYQNMNHNYVRTKKISETYWDFLPGINYGEEAEMIKAYLEDIFYGAEKMEPFDEYLDAGYLKRTFYTVKLMKGETVSQVHGIFSHDELKRLNEAKELTLSKDNKQYFKGNEEVKLTMIIKNIPNLLIKIFEFCPENYYLKEQKELDGTINLDGLIASEEYTHEFSQAPIVKFKREFSFESISKKPKGIFFIDFIGNGLSTRALIWKGSLNYIEEQTVAGQIFTIIDEEKKICKGPRTGIWIKKRLYKADDKGRIIVPYSSEESVQAVLVHEDFAELKTIQLKSENIEFRCSYLYNQESFLMGNKAKVLVQPLLTLNDKPIGFEIATSCTATITTYNDVDLPHKITLDKLKPSTTEELELEFPVPAKLKTVQINIKLKVSQVNNKEDKEYESSETIRFDLHNSSFELCDIYLRYCSTGYELHALGKTGEPKPNLQVNFTFTHQHYRDSIYTSLMTDHEGKIKLGKLNNIIRVYADLNQTGDINSCNKSWVINAHKRINYPKEVTLVEKEEFTLPLLHNELNRSKLSFLEVAEENDQLVLHDYLSKLKINKSSLIVSGLSEGYYVLKLKDVNKTIKFRVIKGSYWQQSQNYVDIDGALLNISQEVNNIVIYDTVVMPKDKDQTRADIILSAYSDKPNKTRFHVYGVQFYDHEILNMISKLDNNSEREQEQKEIDTKVRKAQFMNNRKLGDEYVYVLDRKNKARYVGNTLEKPQILLKNTFVQETHTETENLAETAEFEKVREESLLEKPRAKKMDYVAGGKGIKAKRKMKAALYDSYDNYDESFADYNDPKYYPEERPVNSFLNFLSHPCLLYSNLKLTKEGNVIIKDFPIKNYASVQIVATNTVCNISHIIPLTPTPIQTKDLTLKSQLKEDSFYSTYRGSRKVLQGESFTLNDMTSTEINVIDTIGKLFEAQKVLRLCKGSDDENGGYEFWSFLKDWESLKPEEKLKNYDKYASHEVNIFVYLKDPEFFNTVVKPFIVNKIEKSTIDYILLEDEPKLLNYAKSHNLDKLNALEKVLLVRALCKKHPNDAKLVASSMELQGKSHRIDSKTFELYFDAVLNSQVKEASKLSQLFARGESDGAVYLEAKCDYRAVDLGMYECEVQCLQESAPQRFGRARLARRQMMEEEAECIEEDAQYNNDMFEQNYSDESEGEDDLSYKDEYVQMRKAIRSGFQELEKTKEYQERHYYGKVGKEVNISSNPFWVELAKHFIEQGADKPFLTHNFIYPTSNHTEMIGALSFLSLPFYQASHNYENFEGRGLKLSAASNLLVFYKEIAAGKAELKPEILITQRFFDPNDRYQEDEEDPDVKIEKEVDQYVINKIYGYEVIITNGSAASQEYQVLVEIPEGSIPVMSLDYTKSHTLKLNSHSTGIIETYFYFPKAGNFKVLPCNASRSGKVLAVGKEIRFEVSNQRTFKNLETLNAILSQGSQEDILNFIKTKNIWDSKVFRFSDIYWLLKDKNFYSKVIQILRERKAFDQDTWRFGFYHKDPQAIAEYLENTSNYNPLAQIIPYVQSSLCKIDQLKLLEYHPYVNARVHLLHSEKNQILNNQFEQQYHTFLKYLVYVPKLEAPHYLGLTYYLLLQDRVDDAIEVFARIDKEELKKYHMYELQYDYFAAYLDFYTGYPEFKVARAICEKYLLYPVLSWRSLFIDIANQLAEYDGDEMIEDEVLADTEKKKNQKNAEKEEILTMDLEGTKLNITYKNIKEISVSIYKIDLEILFSRNPFLSQSKDQFTFVQPNHIHHVPVKQSNELERVSYVIPPNLQKSNLFIQLRTEDKTLSTTYFSTSLQVQLIENYGQVKVLDSEDKPLMKVYVKCFAKDKSGKVSFYKDGYTDLRGRFDYATLNSSDVSNIEKFALFIMSDEHGSLTKEANPPKKLGRVEESHLVIRSTNKKFEQYQQNSFQENFMKKAIAKKM